MTGKIAIFGGSFNPVHLGHIRVALHAAEECALDKVIFLPNANPPHKNKADMISPVHRFNMVSLAVEGYESLDISDYEMKSDAPSYTINTMRYMKQKYGSEISFIIGADSLYTLHTWKSYDSLIRECSFIVADRSCAEGSSLKKTADFINKSGGDVRLISMPKIDITSTMIRDLIQSGKSAEHLMPEGVYEYICKNNLYKSCSEDKR